MIIVSQKLTFLYTLLFGTYEACSFFTSMDRPFLLVCIRTSTEGPEVLDKAYFVLAGIDEKSMLLALDITVLMYSDGNVVIPVPDYAEENDSTKVMKLIWSYTDIVNKIV